MTSLKFNMLLSQWQGNVVLVDQQTASVTLHGLQQQGHQWQLSPTKLCDLPMRVDRAKACEVAEDFGLGIRVPFFLITHQLGASQLASGRTCTHELLVCNNTDGRGGSMESYSRFEVPKSCLPDDNTPYLILDGPTVVWSEGARVHMAHSTVESPHTMVQQSFSTQAQMFIGAAAMSGTRFSVSCFWAFDWPQNGIDTSNTLLLFVRVLPEPAWNGDQDDMEVDTPKSAATPRFWLCLQVAAVAESSDLQITLPPDSLIPNDYGFIATSVALHRSLSVDHCGDIFSKCQFVVGTSYQQVVVFENGSMLHCIPMQSIPRRIYTMEVSDGNFALAAWDKNNDVCVVKIAEKKHQKCGSWKDVSGLLVGDFADVGHEQLLLIFDPLNSETITNFSVTDLAQFTASSEMVQTAGATSQPCAESLVSALKALQVREKNGEAYLTNLEREMQEKSHLLERSVTFLKSLGRLDDAAIDQVPKPDPTLVCLLSGNVGILQDQIKKPETTCYPGLEVLQSWQRIIDGQWLVGIVAKNVLECPVQDIGLSLLPVGSKIPHESRSRIISMEKCRTRCDPSADVLPKAKRRKFSGSDMSSSSDDDGAILPPGKKVCVVAKTALPVVLGGTVKAAVVCSWKKQSDVRWNSSREVVELGSVVLSIEQVTDKSLQCCEDCLSTWKGERTLPHTDTEQGSFQDSACFLTARSFIQVEAKSTYTTLLRLPAILKARLPLPSHAVTTSITVRELPGTDQLTSRSSEIFDGVWLYVHFHDDVHSANISILYQNTSQLSLLLEAMRSVLPEDVSIEATSANYREELATCLKLLGRELNAKSASVEQKLQQLKGSSLQNCARSDDDTSELVSQTNSAIVNLLCAP